MIGFLLIIAVAVIAFTLALEKLGETRGKSRSGWFWAAVLALMLFIGFFGLGPINSDNPHLWAQSQVMSATRSIALAMFGYANDHQGNYPDGASSTEVFQKLLDGGYVSDPSMFFLPLPGKVRPKPGQNILKPENVAYDVTSGVTADSSDSLPIVFLTGFRVDYRPDGSAVSLVRPYPAAARDVFDNFPVACHSNNAFLRLSRAGGKPPAFTPNGYGIIPHVVAADFNTAGKSYRQLTPDSALPNN